MLHIIYFYHDISLVAYDITVFIGNCSVFKPLFEFSGVVCLVNTHIFFPFDLEDVYLPCKISFSVLI